MVVLKGAVFIGECYFENVKMVYFLLIYFSLRFFGLECSEVYGFTGTVVYFVFRGEVVFVWFVDGDGSVVVVVGL